MTWKISGILAVANSGLAAARGGNMRVRPMRVAAICRVDALEDRRLFSSIMVLNLSDGGAGSLRDAIAKAGSNDVIQFASSVKGTIDLTSGELPIGKSLTINGPGSSKLAISGNGIGRVFDVTKAGTAVKIDGLSIIDGRAADGAGIDNEGANLSVANCTFTHDQAAGASGAEGRGGAILNEDGGNLIVNQSKFYNNAAFGGYGANGGGGAIYNLTGNSVSSAVVIGGTFLGNRAVGGANGGFGLGGAIINFINGSATASPLSVNYSTFQNNVAQGGAGGGFGVGGGIWTNSDFSSAKVASCTFTSNQAVGGTGGGFGLGGGIANGFGAAITISASLVSDNSAVGGAGGGNGVGGGVANFNIGPDSRPTTAVISGTLFLNNSATGGSQGGAGQGGGIYNGLLPLGPLPPRLPVVQLTVTDSSMVGNQAAGGGGGGAGQGGGVFAELGSQSSLATSIVTGDRAIGGAGGAGTGGGLYIVQVTPQPAVFRLVGSIVTQNLASTGSPDVFGKTV